MDLHPDIAAVLAGERRWCVAHASMLDLLPLLPENSVDSVVTDCPYGLGKEPDVMRMLQAWLAGEAYTPNGKGGFMGREWDAFVPGPHYWRETFRVLKPGGHLVTFCGTRTVDLIGLALRIAGFEIRDGLEWLYGSGFPKSLDVSKKIDEAAGAERETIRAGASGKGVASISSYGDGLNVGFRARPATAPATAPAKEWHGWGTALKPGHEPIILARKPLTGTVAANVLAHGTGALNIGDCRTSAAESVGGWRGGGGGGGIGGSTGGLRLGGGTSGLGGDPRPVDGRWPPNVLLTHSASCRAVGTRAVKANPSWDTPNRATEPSAFTGESVSQVRHTEDVMVEYDCAADCPVRELDGQSGDSPSGGVTHQPKRTGYNGGFMNGTTVHREPDAGTASRYFPQSQWDPQLDDVARFLYCAKAGRSERDQGLEHFRPRTAAEATSSEDGQARLNSPRTGAGRTGGARNPHPTVKPVDLLRWLVRLVTPPKGLVLDPFCGSGSCGMAATLEGFRYLGVELNDTDEEPFASIARARITWIEGGNYVPRESLRAPKPPAQASLFAALGKAAAE